jgi:hypothetical protein
MSRLPTRPRPTLQPGHQNATQPRKTRTGWQRRNRSNQPTKQSTDQNNHHHRIVTVTSLDSVVYVTGFPILPRTLNE